MNNMFCYCKNAINNYHERIRRLEVRILASTDEEEIKKLKAELRFQKLILKAWFVFEILILVKIIIG